MQNYSNVNQSGCPCRTIGSIQKHKSTLTSETLERADRGKVKQYHPLDLRKELEQRKTERVFEPFHCPPEIIKAVLARDSTIESIARTKVPIRPGWIKEMKKPEHGNTHFFCIPSLSLHLVRDIYTHMFGDVSGLPKREDDKKPIWNWWVISGTTKVSVSGNLSLPNAVLAHLVFRRVTGVNLFNSPRLITSDNNGRRTVIVVDPRDGKISIPKCEWPPERGDSHPHGVLLG